MQYSWLYSVITEKIVAIGYIQQKLCVPQVYTVYLSTQKVQNLWCPFNTIFMHPSATSTVDPLCSYTFHLYTFQNTCNKCLDQLLHHLHPVQHNVEIALVTVVRVLVMPTSLSLAVEVAIPVTVLLLVATVAGRFMEHVWSLGFFSHFLLLMNP